MLNISDENSDEKDVGDHLEKALDFVFWRNQKWNFSFQFWPAGSIYVRYYHYYVVLSITENMNEQKIKTKSYVDTDDYRAHKGVRPCARTEFPLFFRGILLPGKLMFMNDQG